MMNYAAQHILSARAQRTPTLKIGVLWLGLCIPFLLAALLLATLSSQALAAVSVTPLSEDVFNAPINDVTLPADKQRNTGPLIPEEVWKRYSNRPNALASHPQGRVAVAEVYPNGATGYIRDPAYLPILPMEQPKGATKPRKTKKPAVTSPYGPAAIGPITPKVASPTVPTVASPKVVSPTVPPVPTVAGATPPTTPKTATVAAPYSSAAAPTGEVASPTNPMSPANPANPMSPANPAASPSLAGQPSAQDGIMATGRGIVSDMVPKYPAPNSATGVATGTTGSASGANSSGQLTVGDRRTFIGGAANTLVVPPEGISLQPNNGAAALTAPPQTQ